MQTIVSTISITMVLVLTGLVVLSVLSVRKLSRQVREDLTVTVVLKDDVPTDAAHSLCEELMQKEYVSDVQYISAEEALNEQTQLMGIDPSGLLGANPFSISMELKVKAAYAVTDSLASISQRIKEHELVSDVIYQQELAESLNRNLQRMISVLLIIAGLLLVVSVSLINNTVRLSVYGHRFVIHTMQLVGAPWSFICRPLLVRSIWMGAVSALAATIVLMLGIGWAGSYDESIASFITPSMKIATTAACLLTGLLVSVLCTYISVIHYLNKKENELYP